MVRSANIGYPSIGKFRELKKSLEAYWKGAQTEQQLLDDAKKLRMTHLEYQQARGTDIVPSNDFSFYDRVLDTAFALGAVPERYNAIGGEQSLTRYFAMARGSQKDGADVTAMEMTKWFDTNYHYIVPELHKGQTFSLNGCPAVDRYKEAKAAGAETRPTLIGPMTFLLLSKLRKDEESARLSLAPALAAAYKEILAKLKEEGATRVQIEEPCLATDLSADTLAAYKATFATLAEAGVDIDLAVYFGPLRDNLDTALSLPFRSLHIDAVRGAEEIEKAANGLPADAELSVGVIDGRNIWKTDLDAAIAKVKKAVDILGSDRVIAAPSCSLLHVPADLGSEKELDADIKDCLSFALQKLEELDVIKNYFNTGEAEVKDALEKNRASIKARRESARIHNDAVKTRVKALSPQDSTRAAPFAERKRAQQNELQLPLLPTTTIGSLPQTQEIRQKRRAFKDGNITEAEYNAFLKEKTDEAMRFQDEIGIDVPVHGEYERNDMVEYFGEQLEGVGFTRYGWVQSYGSRCVKPPIIFGDVSRPNPMTVEWSAYAKSKTDKPVKGMLTGPVTILQWSFVRDDQPRSDTCKQIALAIRDEVTDLEAADIRVIQIDEPAFREGLPLRANERQAYLDWAGECFRISASGVQNGTQIHTHMCYCEFNDIIDAIAGLDADVISIETSRSAMELLDAFKRYDYPNDIGPGVYDIHSPRIPATDEMVYLLDKALEVLEPGQMWVNPDCGLKTRGWDETAPALKNMVEAARQARKKAAEKAA